MIGLSAVVVAVPVQDQVPELSPHPGATSPVAALPSPGPRDEGS